MKGNISNIACDYYLVLNLQTDNYRNAMFG